MSMNLSLLAQSSYLIKTCGIKIMKDFTSRDCFLMREILGFVQTPFCINLSPTFNHHAMLPLFLQWRNYIVHGRDGNLFFNNMKVTHEQWK